MKGTPPQSWAPDRGEAVWLDFEPHAGHEQGGRRPAVVLSAIRYNGKVGLAMMCPVTSRGRATRGKFRCLRDCRSLERCWPTKLAAWTGVRGARN